MVGDGEFYDVSVVLTMDSITLTVDGQSTYSSPVSAHVVSTNTVYDGNANERRFMFTGGASLGASDANVQLRYICIKSSFYPIWSKEYGSQCHVKQNTVAETMTALKSYDS